jgi:hypothetical protein
MVGRIEQAIHVDINRDGHIGRFPAAAAYHHHHHHPHYRRF